MATGIVVRYRAKPECVVENERLVRVVYAELAAARPDGFHYMTLRLDDDVTFVHVALHADGSVNPLPELPAFQRFQAGLADRLADGPEPSPATGVGSYASPG